MARQSVIRIKAEIIIPYDRKLFGRAGAAEELALELKDTLGKQDGTQLVKFAPEHTSVEVKAEAAE